MCYTTSTTVRMATIRITIKPIREYARGSVAHVVLGCVAQHAQSKKNTPGSAPTTHIIAAFDPKTSEERNRVWKALKYLESQNHLTLSESLGERYVTLTPTGWNAAAIVHKSAQINSITPRTPKEWDGLWRFVMFDIPLSHEQARIPMKQKLLDFGFATYQKSVFIHPHDLRNEVSAVADFLGVRNFVRFVTARSISAEDEFKELFDLM